MVITMNQLNTLTQHPATGRVISAWDKSYFENQVWEMTQGA